MIVAGTGHRPDRLIRTDIRAYTSTQHLLLVRLCEKYIKFMGATSCISGMALGFDQAFAHATMNLHLPLIAAVPFRDQSNIWRKESRFFWRYLIDYATLNGEVHYLADHYNAKVLMDRNRWMVDHCDQLLACCNDIGSSGTASCITYANLKNKPVTNIWADFLSFNL